VKQCDQPLHWWRASVSRLCVRVQTVPKLLATEMCGKVVQLEHVSVKFVGQFHRFMTDGGKRRRKTVPFFG